MSYTEIPNGLLLEAYDILQWIDDEVGRADAWDLTAEIKDGGGLPVDPATYDVVVRFTWADIERMKPLVKWLEYVTVVWGAGLDSRMPAKAGGR